MPFIKFTSLTAFAFSTAAIPLTAMAENWTGYTYSAVSTTAAVQGVQKITEQVEAETNGDLSITLHLGKTLQIAPEDITQAVGDGIVDFAADFFFSGNVPIARVLNLPMLIENDEEWQVAYTAMEPYLLEGFENQGAILLGGYRYPQQVIFSTFPVDRLDDLAGHKIRVTSPEQGGFVESFGASAITLSGSEVPTALERGVIDGLLTASAGGAKNWHEFLPHNYRFAVNYGNAVIIANADRFEALDPETQQRLRDIVAEEGQAITAAFLQDEEDQKASQQQAGMTIVEAAEEDTPKAREALAPFWEEWAAQNGAEYEQALADVRAALGK